MTKISDTIRKLKNTTCSVVVVAGGSSTRMGQDKLMMDLCGLPVLARTLRVFDRCDFVREIVLVMREDCLQAGADLCREYGIRKVDKVIAGGATRNESALNGLMAISGDAKIVLIHDGARPLVTPEIVYEAMHTAALYKCASPAIPVVDTVKEAENGVVVKTFDRSRLNAIQTPQAFVPEIIKAALTKAIQTGTEYTDDCAAVEALGIPVHLFDGSPENIKIPRPADIYFAESILKARG